MSAQYPTLAGYIVLFSVLFIAVYTDTRSHRIPNWLTMGGIFLALIMSLGRFGGIPPSQLFLGTMAGLAIYLPLYLIGKLGAGDVKLMAFCGAILGLKGVLWTAVLSTLAGGFLAVGWLLYHLGVRESFYRALAFTSLVHAKDSTVMQQPKDSPMKMKMPYAIAIACGAAIYVWRVS